MPFAREVPRGAGGRVAVTQMTSIRNNPPLKCPFRDCIFTATDRVPMTNHLKNRHLEQAVFPKCKGMRSGDGTEIRCPDCGWICLKHIYEKHKGSEECKSYAWRKQMVELEKIRNRPRTTITLLAADVLHPYNSEAWTITVDNPLLLSAAHLGTKTFVSFDHRETRTSKLEAFPRAQFHQPRTP